MFISENIPVSYRFICEVSDNYIVLSNVQNMNSNTDYEVYIQYLKPSTCVLHLYDYRIKYSNAQNVSLDYIYDNNGYYNYLDNSNISYSISTMEIDRDDYSNDIFERADFTSILICATIILYFVFKCIFCVTSLVDKEVF